MGVTYKLKPEIVEAIIQKKTDNPKMGCRKIAEEISVVFGVKVSKSSVNTVLKEADLSSSVGRRSNEEFSKNFTIPSAKKKQLQENVHKLGLTDKPAEKKDLLERKKTEKPFSILDIPSAIEDGSKKENAEQILNDSADELPLILESSESIVGDFAINSVVNESVNERDVISQRWSQKQAGMGNIFVFMMYCVLGFDKSLVELVEGVLKRSCSRNEQVALNIWFDFWTFGIKEIREIKDSDQHFIWTQYDDLLEEKDVYLGLLSEILIKLKGAFIENGNLSNFIQKMDIFGSCVKGYEVGFISGRRIFLDAKMGNVGADKSCFDGKVFLENALEQLSKELISGQDMVYLFSKPLNSNDLEIFNFWIQFLNNPSVDKVTDIQVVDENNEGIGRYDVFVHTKREFSVGLYPNDLEYIQSAKIEKWTAKKIFYDVLSDNEFFIGETNLNGVDQGGMLKGVNSRVISVEENSDNGVRFAILTNNLDMTVEEIVLRYFMKFSFGRIKKRYFSEEASLKVTVLGENKKNSFTSDWSGFVGKTEDFSVFEILEYYFEQVNRLFVQQIQTSGCSTSKAVSSIYDISGQHQKYKNYLLIRLEASSDKGNGFLLNSAIQAFSQISFYNKNGQNISFL